ncbi:hypothetical protein FNH09_07565 [Streptomyces adustus]|uniref:Uncharacterized protein n=1 Tax=Streptomyces adustus TaxID=1609272 RepID=A0A5N8VAX1_9ACTN|nr:hypothetical protein [Streptomyces adustus]MPY31174.1 hypothetical protein [Streptomyces adustus]
MMAADVEVGLSAAVRAPGPLISNDEVAESSPSPTGGEAGVTGVDLTRPVEAARWKKPGRAAAPDGRNGQDVPYVH